MSSAPVQAGDLLAGRYRVERVLGAGGMGMVVAARHERLKEPVAIKLLLPEVSQNPDIVSRFLREARAAVRIRSEHVVRVTDVDTLESGLPFMVMEYLEGSDLEGVLHERGSLPQGEALSLLVQCCEAIAAAHALGIVHRDLKPANLFLTRRVDGSACLKVLDFGISKTAAETDSVVTRTTAVMGTPLYMSPEQLASTRDVDARTDVWALGAILYEMLAGKPAFSGETMPQLCTMILHGEPEALRERAPAVPDGLEEVIRRCLEKDRNKRYSSAAELAAALCPFAPPEVRPSAERISTIQAPGSAPGAAPLSGPAGDGGNERWRMETMAAPPSCDPAGDTAASVSVPEKAPVAEAPGGTQRSRSEPPPAPALRTTAGTSREVEVALPRQAPSRRPLFIGAAIGALGLAAGIALVLTRGPGPAPSEAPAAGSTPSAEAPAAPASSPAEPPSAPSPAAAVPSSAAAAPSPPPQATSTVHRDVEIPAWHPGASAAAATPPKTAAPAPSTAPAAVTTAAPTAAPTAPPSTASGELFGDRNL